MKEVQATLDEVCAAKFEKDRARGIKNRPVRAMVVGIPNVGKSTFINSFAGKAVAKTGNKASYITDNTHTEEHPIHQNKSAMLFCSMAISLSAAVLCVYILHAVTKAISANLYVIRYIHKTDGMK